jgi:hypothetical protein
VADLRGAEARLGVELPAELRILLKQFNGTDATDVDHGWVTFWSTDQLELVGSGNAGDYELPGAVVFADHSLCSWWYAVETEATGGTRVFRLARSEPEVVATSLGEFLCAVVDGDDDVLY